MFGVVLHVWLGCVSAYCKGEGLVGKTCAAMAEEVYWRFRHDGFGVCLSGECGG